MFIGSVVLAVLVRTERLSPFLPLTVRPFLSPFPYYDYLALTVTTDAKQARDLVHILTESKQQIDPRLAEMTRFGGGGGGNRWGGGRGRGRGGGGGGFTASNAAPLGHARRW